MLAPPEEDLKGGVSLNGSDRGWLGGESRWSRSCLCGFYWGGPALPWPTAYCVPSPKFMYWLPHL